MADNRTDAEKDTEQVAGIIYHNIHYSVTPHTDEEAWAEAVRINDQTGWSYDITYGGEGRDNWTRVEGRTLTETELRAAFALAAEWWAADVRLAHGEVPHA